MNLFGLTHYLSLIFCCLPGPKQKEDALPDGHPLPALSTVKTPAKGLDGKSSPPPDVHHLPWASTLLMLMFYRDQFLASAIEHDAAFGKSDR